MQKYNQVTGGSCRLVMFRETKPGVIDSADDGVLLSMMSETFSAPASKQSSSVISGKRGAGKPYQGAPEYSGGVELAPYAPLIGHVLRALCGAPATSPESAVSISGSVTDEGHGYVGLPCSNNPFVQDTVISVLTDGPYRGSYRVEYGSTASRIVIKAPFSDSTIEDASVIRGRAAWLTGEAVNLGSGKVGLPVSGLGASLNVGESIEIVGDANYAGTHVLLDGTAARQLVISAAFTEGTVSGFARPVFSRHVFVLPKRQPTVCVEKYLDYDSEAGANAYTRFTSCKLNELSFPFGGDDELKLSLSFSVGSGVTSSESVSDSIPHALPAVPFQNREVALWINGERTGDIQSGTLTLNFGIEAGTAVGDMGRRTRQPEGEPSCTCDLVAFLEHDEYARLSEAAATIPFALSISGSGGDELWISFPEAELDTSGAQISGKAGLTQEVKATGFVDQGDAVVTFTLINRIGSYA